MSTLGVLAGCGGVDPYPPEGDLRSTLTYRAARDHVLIGSPRVYASTMQFGAQKGAFGTNSIGRSIPWGDIPARPFLGLSDDDHRDIDDTLRDWIARQWL